MAGKIGMMSRKADEEVLNILDALYCEMEPAKEIKARFGITNSKLQGIKHRHTRSDLPCECIKPENKNGGMPDRWWSK